MRLEATKYLEDVRQAAGQVLDFTRDKTWDDYAQDGLLRAGVERQFQIIGEALNQLRRVQPDVVPRISHFKRIIAFRNILIHAYAIVDDRVVWDIVQTNLPLLAQEIEVLLHPEDGT